MSDRSSIDPVQSAVPAILEVSQLDELSRRASPPRIVDLRWVPKRPTALEKYREAHIPGAVFVDLDRDLSQPGGPGRHPFPAAARFAALLGSLGIAEDTHVVVYDDGAGAIAARLWFMLRAHGHARASVLNGGLAAWRAAGLPLAKGDETARPVPSRMLRLDAARVAERAQIRALLRERGDGGPGKPLLLDARARPRYRGEFEPLDARAGHIPGAVNAPYEENLLSAADPRMKAPAELRRQLESLGVGSASEVVVSCGSGVTACHDALAMELAGFPLPRLYVGSFSEWASAPEEAIATGPEPGKLG